MNILITGANSYVGARLYHDLSRAFPVTGTYAHNKLFSGLVRLDITDKAEVRELIGSVAPDVIIHAQANANARWCESNPEEADLVNRVATGHIVDAADKAGAKVVYISSFAAIEPTTHYGRTKLASEEFVRGTRAGHIILRPSFILGYSPNTVNDRPFNRLLRNLDDGVPAVYDTSWKFHPTYLRHIGEVIRACLERNIANVTLPVVVPEVSTRFGTARDILSPFGITVLPADNKDTTPNHDYDVNALKRLGLPEYSYEDMIRGILDEIRHRERFVPQ